MTKTTTDHILDLLDGISNALDSIIIKDEVPETTAPEKVETEGAAVKTSSTPRDPFSEALRILSDLEEYAQDHGDTDLALAVADRYITLGREFR